MASDRILAGNFWLHEFSGWEQATEADVAALQETAQRVLQPVRQRFGKVVPSSWLYWSDGTPRTGAHAYGGTVDFVTPNADLREVWEWGKTYLLPSGYIGRWIYEPERAPTDTHPGQGEHIHMAPVEDMVAYVGDRKIQALEEVAEGQYVVAREYFNGTGTELAPFELPGIQVAGVRGFSWPWLLLGLGLFVNLAGTGRARTSSS